MIALPLGLSALIHLLPLSGVLGATRLEALYGPRIEDPTVLLAMRHRAVMFGVLGVWLLVAIALPEQRTGAIGVTLACDAAFMMLMLNTEGTHAKMEIHLCFPLPHERNQGEFLRASVVPQRLVHLLPVAAPFVDA